MAATTSSKLAEWGGLPAPSAGESTARFPDGAAFRIEIPSVEGPRCMEAVLEEARRLEVPVTRVSQGSGIELLTDAEIAAMVDLGREQGVEVCLFARPSAGWDVSASSRASAGAAFASVARGAAHLEAALRQIARAADLGVRSVLIADYGVLSAFGRARADGVLPPDMQAKVSVMMAVSNPATARVLVDLGADTVNVSPDLTIDQIAEIRSEIGVVPIDMYVEAPDDIGGFVRYHEVAELVRRTAPVYVKLGLRNAALIYPSGGHWESTAVALGIERVRRARIALEALGRGGVDLASCSLPGAAGLAIPGGRVS